MKKNKVNNLAFNKANIVELNNNQLIEVVGGSVSSRICDGVRDLVDDIIDVIKPRPSIV